MEAYTPCSIEELKPLFEGRTDLFGQQAKKLYEQFELGDAFGKFCTDKASWRQGFGSEGYRLSRQGSIIGVLVTRMN